MLWQDTSSIIEQFYLEFHQCISFINRNIFTLLCVLSLILVYFFRILSELYSLACPDDTRGGAKGWTSKSTRNRNQSKCSQFIVMLRNCILLSPIFIAALGQVMRWQQILQQMRSTAKVQGETSNTHLFTHTHTHTYPHSYLYRSFKHTDWYRGVIHTYYNNFLHTSTWYVCVCVWTYPVWHSWKYGIPLLLLL